MARVAVRVGECGRESLTSLGEVRVEVEEPTERAGQLQRPRGVRRDPVEGGAQVVELRLERVRPPRLSLEPARVRGLGESGEIRGVPFADVGLLGAFGEAVLCELADRLEHREPLAAPAQQAVIDERRERFEHFAANRFCRVEREPAGERRQPRKEQARVGVEEFHAPLDRRAQRALTLGDVTRAARQQRESLLEPRENRGRREDRRLRRGELDRQRQAVELAADLRDLWRCNSLRSLDEQRDGVVAGEWRHFEGPLGAQAQRCAARSQHDDVRPRVENSRDVLRRLGQMFEVVEDEEQASGTQKSREALAAELVHAERAGDHRRNQIGVVNGGETDEERAVWKVRHELVGDAERETRLAGAARPDQRDEPRAVPHEPNERGDFIRPSDQRRSRTREVRRRGFRARRRELVLELVGDDLVEVLRARQDP